MSKSNTNKAKNGRPGNIPNRQGLYSLAASYSKEAIEVLADIMRNSSNESLRMGAAKALLDKALPDIKATEITGEDHGPLAIRIVADPLPKYE